MTHTLIIVFGLWVLASSAQTTNCDTIYDLPETMPQYENDVKGLTDYLNKKLIPILSDCMKQDGELIASLYIVLTIDAKGNIIDADFPRLHATNNCKEELKQEIITMTGWTPGKINGQAVCSRFSWPISCLKWE